MDVFSSPTTNFNDPDEVLAQTIAADKGWQHNNAGHIFDNSGTYVANGLSELAAVMRNLGWFTPRDAAGTGVFWSNVPSDSETVSRQVRAEQRRIQAHTP